MPYNIEKKGDMFCVYDRDTGDIVGEHDIRQKAVAQMRALNAEKGKSDKKKSDKSDKSKKKSKKQNDHEENHDY